jgi:hypothetical protein
VFWGDRFGLWFWVACAAVLILLHVIDCVGSLLARP